MERESFSDPAIAERMTVESLGLEGDFQAVVKLRAPVPIRVGGEVAVAAFPVGRRACAVPIAVAQVIAMLTALSGSSSSKQRW